MDGPIIGYVWTPWVGPRGQFRPILGSKNGGFLIIFIRILQFIWDLGLVSSDSPKDAVSGKILVFDKIFLFPGVNWAQKWTKNEDFGYILFVLKHLILKHSHPVLLLWWATSGPNLDKFEPYLGKKGPRSTQEGPVLWLLHCHENIWKFITFEPQMLGWWSLPWLCIIIRPLIWQKIGAWPVGCRRVWSKSLWEKAKKLVFRLHFLEFSGLYQKRCHM